MPGNLLGSVSRFSVVAVCAWSLQVLVGCADHAPVELDEPTATYRAALTVPSSDILGFESLSGWTPQSGQEALSSDRTRGNKAYALSGLSGYVSVVSAELSSSAPELANLGVGSRLSIDVKLPQNQSDPWWHGAIQMFLSAPSKNLHDVYLGQNELTSLPKGKYVTLHFTVPEAAGQALAGASYDDLTLRVVLNVPQNSPGTYRLDNLRLRGAFPTGGTEDVQAGESVTLRAWLGYGGESSQVDDVTFSQGVIQIPERFRVVEGNAGNGTAKLEYAAAGTSLSACTYVADTVTSGTHYKLGSCAGGAVAGDLVPANRLKLTVVSGDGGAPRTKIFAQIAKNPLGDELGSIAPIPTYFGANAAEAEAILTAYSTAQTNWPITSAKLVRVPTPQWPFYTSVSENNEEELPPPPPNTVDPPFFRSGNVTGMDILDAQWKVSGALAITLPDERTRVSSIDSSLEVTGVTLGADWLLGRLTASASTTTTDHANGDKDVAGGANFCYNFFGVYTDCESFTGDIAIPKRVIGGRADFTVFTLPWWVFSMDVSVGADYGVDANLNLFDDGVSMGFTPFIDAGVRFTGQVSLGNFGGGGIDGEIDIISVKVPGQMKVSAPVDKTPGVCEIQPEMAFSMDVEVSSLSGEITWFLQGGFSCGFWDGGCWRTEGVLFAWDGFSLGTLEIVPDGPIGILDPLPWPEEDCPTGISLNVWDPSNGDVFTTGQTIWVNFDASRYLGQDVIQDIDCVYGNVTSSNPGDVLDPATEESCGRRLTLSGGPGERDISVQVTDLIGTSGVVVRRIYVVDPVPGSPPIPTITTDRNVIDCQFGLPATLTPSFTYAPPGDPANVDLYWFRGDELLPNPGNEPLVVYNAPRGGRTYWLVAVDRTDYTLQSGDSAQLRSQCVH